MECPLLPWEVIERIINHSGDHPITLHNFSLTCRSLRPRALCLLVAHVVFKSRPSIFNFCDFIKAKPHLNPLVRSITVNPNDFAPFPFLYILPNLSELTFAPVNSNAAKRFKMPLPTVVNQSSLTCCQRFGTHIQTLHLSKLSFSTYLEFARVLLAFTNVTHLVCSGVSIGAEGNRAPLEVIKRRLFEQLRLLTVNIYFAGTQEGYYDAPSVAALLLDSGLVQSTVEALTVRGMYRSHGLPQLLTWPRLRTLVLKLAFTARDVTDAIVFLEAFTPSTLKDVTVELGRADISSILETLSEAHSGLLEKLEKALLRFPHPRIVCLSNKLRDGGNLFWTQELGRHFPVLSRRGAFIMAPRTVTPGVGHDSDVEVLVTSLDGKWVATGARDGTIILWETTNGAIHRQWAAHNYRILTSLAFSPDSRYLASCGDHPEVKIWDLNAYEVASLKGHSKPITRCAWSPRGDVIASASQDKTIRLWDARTFRQLHVLEQPDANIQLTAFSPDGRWLVSGLPSSCEYRILDVGLGTLHRKLRGRLDSDDTHFLPLFAAFDPGSARLVIAPEHGVAKIVDVESGAELVALRGTAVMSDAAFSPDGTLVVTASTGGMVKVWDAHTGLAVFAFKGNKKHVSHWARFSPCGKYFASASFDGVVRLWRTKGGSRVATFSGHNDSGVYHIAFSPDGETIWSTDSVGTVIMRRMCDIIPKDKRDP